MVTVTMNNVLTLILGGGRGNRLFPLTRTRSKPAVPIGGRYRLIDVPVSNCLHADLRKIFVLTQFNSASLNRHIAQTYRLDLFSKGYVDILAAEQTPDSMEWFQGTADAVRQASRHFRSYDADYYLILAGDHLYRMDLRDLVRAHISKGADVTIAAQPCDPETATQMGIFLFDDQGQIRGFEEKPNSERLTQLDRSVPPGSAMAADMTDDKPFMASMGIYVFSRDVLLDALDQFPDAIDFGKQIIPRALDTHKVRAYLYDGYWADVGTVGSFFDANLQLTERGAAFSFHDPKRPIYTHPRFLGGSMMSGASLDRALVAEGCVLDRCTVTSSVVGIRTQVGADTKVSRSVLLGADYYQHDGADPSVPIGIGRNVVLDRVIVDKNAHIGDDVSLTNEAGVEHADGDGYFIREGIIVVPKGATVPPGTRA